MSSIYDAPMPYSVFFNGGIAFHQGSVRVTSHGCVHLTATAARSASTATSRTVAGQSQVRARPRPSGPRFSPDV